MKELLRSIPKVTDFFCQEPILRLQEEHSPAAVTGYIRTVLERLRAGILAGDISALPEMEELCALVGRQAEEESMLSLRRVINGTGVILHTNLGRSCLSAPAAAAACEIAGSYSTLEYDLAKGKRGSRHDHVTQLLRRLTGAESAMVVNNNAAAVMLALSTIGRDGEVITSRGELVEIGGSFRVPDIMELCSCRLREVGTTNKTHLYDYERAIGEQTKALLKVHTSNYRIVGFTESVPQSELVALGHGRGLPVIEDLGSGCLVDLERYGIYHEPTVQASLKVGMDIVTFSGDKLLGGPQAGIILGRKSYIDAMKANPLARAIRVDKMTLAALCRTLQSYLDIDRAEREIPVLAMLSASRDTLRARAALLQKRLSECGISAEVTAETGPVGGGAAPTQELPTYAVGLLDDHRSANTLEQLLRHGTTPIIGRIRDERYLLDVRTLWESDFDEICHVMAEALL